MVKRSYEKPENMLCKKDFVRRNLFGERFDKNIYRDGYDIEYAQQNLSPYGKELIKKLIEENKQKGILMDKKQEELFHEYHSKIPKRGSIDYFKVDSSNPLVNSKIIHGGEGIRYDPLKHSQKPLWKSGLHVMEHFGPPLIDKYYIFDEPAKTKYSLNQPPFKRPKDEGDYFDKDIHILGGPYDKLVEAMKGN